MRAAFAVPEANISIIGVLAPLVAGNMREVESFSMEILPLKLLLPVNVCVALSKATFALKLESGTEPGGTEPDKPAAFADSAKIAYGVGVNCCRGESEV